MTSKFCRRERTGLLRILRHISFCLYLHMEFASVVQESSDGSPPSSFATWIRLWESPRGSQILIELWWGVCLVSVPFHLVYDSYEHSLGPTTLSLKIGTSSIYAPPTPNFQLSVTASRTDANALRWNTSLSYGIYLFFLDRSFQNTIALRGKFTPIGTVAKGVSSMDSDWELSSPSSRFACYVAIF